MNDRRWIRVTALENLPLREGRAVLLGDVEVALFNLGPSTELGARVRVLATHNECPHQGGPLCDGIVTGDSVVCPLHAWKVNLASGEVERPANGRDHCVETYPTRIEDGIVMVGLPAMRDDVVGAVRRGGSSDPPPARSAGDLDGASA
ncbi:MAG TPA: Rieske 2Fe-2S domain-containing protein [Vicinamibacterales bacterium]|nr:Rieske 2Fe-2S domain-containing protein [Vicinamibacterales bacterium]